MLRSVGLTVCLSVCAATAAAPQTGGFDEGCRGFSTDRAYHCEIRDDMLGGGVPLRVDARPNGGIRVHGWDRGDVALRARVIAYADTEDEARRLASQVRIDTAGGNIRAFGPEADEGRHWVVSYELRVPQNSHLTLTTKNGGISVRHLRGTVSFDAVNGGIRLENVGGDFRGRTTNGGVTVDLSGHRWEGAGLDIETRNGGVRLSLPADYSAELETGTTNGRMSVDFPLTVHGLIGNRLNTTLGAGGARIRAITRNGGVRITRRS